MIIGLSVLQGRVQAQSNAVYEFLRLPGSARLTALGASQAAILHPDITTISANPALLDSTQNEQIQASYLNYLAGINMGVISGALNVPTVGMMAAHIRYMNYGRIPRTDAEGNTLGEFSPQDLALQVALSRELLPQLTGGIQASLIHQNYDVYGSTGISVDAGLTYRFANQEALLGLALHSMGTQLSTFNGTRETLPFSISLGFAQQLQYLPVRLHIGLNDLQDWSGDTATQQNLAPLELLLRKVSLGSEWVFGEHVLFRLGYQVSTNTSLNLDRRVDPAGLRAGLGIQLNSLQFDIGYHSYSSLGALTMLTVRTNLSQLR
jgi:hypothetical protein